MKKIFIISQSLNTGGAERVASNLSLELSKNLNYKVYLVLFDGNNQTYPAGCEVIDMQLPPKNNKLLKIINFFKRIKKLKKLKKQYEVDVSISLLNSPNIINVLSKYKDKTIVSVRNLMIKSKLGLFGKLSLKYSSKKADKVVSLSELVKIDLVNNYNIKEDKIITIYNSCDKEKLLENSKKDDVKIPKYEYVVNVGRLSNQKGQWHLIKAFKLIHKEFPNLKLVILGEGSYRKRLEQLICDLNLEDSIYLYGYVKSPHIIIQNAKLFLFTSLYEGLGNVLLEAIACETPVISVDCPAGPKEILKKITNFKELNIPVKDIEYSDYGILTPPFDSNIDYEGANKELNQEEILFASAVIEVLKNSELIDKYKKICKKRIKDFSVEIINNQWINLIDSL